MRTPGPVEATLVVQGAGQGQKLRAGALISVTVLESPSPGRYLVLAGGQRLLASGPLGLRAGSMFRARVESSASGLVLHALPASRPGSGEIAGIIARSGLPDDSFSRLALTALLGEGLQGESRSLARVRRAFARQGSDEEGGGNSDRGKLAARMEAAGLEAEAGALDAISEEAGLGAQGGGLAGSGGQGQGPNQGESGQGRGSGEGRLGGGPEGAKLVGAIPEHELPSVLGKLIKDLVLGSGGEGSLLNLFNHARGLDGSWVYAPFRFELDSVAFSGCFRVKLPLLVGGPGRIEADFEAKRDGAEPQAWSIELVFGNRGGIPGLKPGASSLRLRTKGGRAGVLAPADLAGLASQLASAGCRVELDTSEEGGSASVPGGLDLDA